MFKGRNSISANAMGHKLVHRTVNVVTPMTLTTILIDAAALFVAVAAIFYVIG